MPVCTEIAVFRVAAADQERVLALSAQIFSEMDLPRKVLVSSQVLSKAEDAEELCWQLTYVDAAAAAATKARWPELASTSEFQRLVEKNVYFGHFLPAGG